jgi:hypothetical protein
VKEEAIQDLKDLIDILKVKEFINKTIGTKEMDDIKKI